MTDLTGFSIPVPSTMSSHCSCQRAARRSQRLLLATCPGTSNNKHIAAPRCPLLYAAPAGTAYRPSLRRYERSQDSPPQRSEIESETEIKATSLSVLAPTIDIVVFF
jgi:hypothetical protein